MSKKLNLLLMTAAAALFAVGCSEEKTDVEEGNTATVTFTVSADGQNATRAISDGTTCDELIYRVLDENGAVISGLAKTTKETSFPTTVSINLIKGQTYKIVFWAQDKDCSAYTVSDDMKVTVDYEGVNNYESRDAFFKTIDYTVTGSASVDVVLKRPFAQVNVGTTADDWNAAKASGMTVSGIQSSATFKGLANVLNLVDGSVSGDADASYTVAAIPTERLVIKNGTDTTHYYYLSMSYILPDADTASTTVEASFTFTTDQGDITLSEGLHSLPVQRNYRTNILGSFLTSTVTFNVVIDPIYDGDHNQEIHTSGFDVNGTFYDTFAEAVTAVNALTDTDITVEFYSDGTWATGGAGGNATNMFTNSSANITLVGNGHSLTATGAGGIVNNAASVTFDNVVIKDETAYGYENGETAWEFTYLEFQGSADYVFTDCEFVNSAMFSNNATATNCKFEGKATLTSNQSEEYCLWVSNGETVTFTGCDFSNGYRGLKICDMYGTDHIGTVTVDGCVFHDLAKKPGICIDDANDPNDMVVTIKNSQFNNTKVGKTGGMASYIYEVTNAPATLTAEDNTIDGGVSINETTKTTSILNATGWNFFVNQVNVNKMVYTNLNVTLANDIDFGGATLSPIGQTGSTTFAGIFDGQSHTLSNFTIDETGNEGEYHAAGLFGWVEDHTETCEIKNLNVDGATVSGHHYVAAIAGYSSNLVSGCNVTNSNISCSLINESSDGDKAGSVVGYVNPLGANTKVENCTASNGTVKAFRDAGQVVGAAKASLVSGCSATDVEVSTLGSGTVGGHTAGENVRNEVIGRVLSES